MRNKKETQRKAKKRRFETEGKGQERKRKIYHVQMSAKIHQDNEIRAPFSAINLQKKKLDAVTMSPGPRVMHPRSFFLRWIRRGSVSVGNE